MKQRRSIDEPGVSPSQSAKETEEEGPVSEEGHQVSSGGGHACGGVRGEPRVHLAGRADLGERRSGEEVELKREWEERAWNQAVQRNVAIKGSREIGGLWRGKWGPWNVLRWRNCNLCLYADGNDPIKREELLECCPRVSEKGWNLVCECVCVCGSVCVCAGRGLLRSTDFGNWK